MLSAAAACGLDTGETHRGRVEYSPTTRPAAARHLAVSLSAASTRRHMASAAAAADPGAAYKLLLSCPAGLPRSRVSVKFDQSFDRIPHPDAALEESISVIWNQRLKQNPSSYSGTKFRYGGHAVHYKDEPNKEYCVSLHLGLTDYSTFVGTNLNPLWEKFLVPSEDDSVHCQHMSNPLGNGAIVQTSDEKIIVLQRSYNVGEFPGYFVFPGGHSEPQEIGILAHQTDEKDLAVLNERVSQEMFDGIIREVVEETGVPSNSLSLSSLEFLAGR
ncbi:hypothetical protein DAI22_05g013700 [Oryza sativa Japonica Group]|nr:hypothetical protein DAI22_05g013700 [Oryza sativa Japonica Group]